MLSYREPKIFGSGSAALEALASDGERSVLLVTDSFIAESETVAELKKRGVETWP